MWMSLWFTIYHFLCKCDKLRSPFSSVAVAVFLYTDGWFAWLLSWCFMCCLFILLFRKEGWRRICSWIAAWVTALTFLLFPGDLQLITEWHQTSNWWAFVWEMSVAVTARSVCERPALRFVSLKMSWVVWNIFIHQFGGSYALLVQNVCFQNYHLPKEKLLTYHYAAAALCPTPALRMKTTDQVTAYWSAFGLLRAEHCNWGWW